MRQEVCTHVMKSDAHERKAFEAQKTFPPAKAIKCLATSLQGSFQSWQMKLAQKRLL